jgi:hypothetical protein
MDLGVGTFFKDISQHWSGYVTALSIIGGVSMALLQTLKDLLPIRQAFQEWYLQRWIAVAVTEANAKFGPVSADTGTKDLLDISVNGDEAAFYDLQIEQLCGQYTAAMQIVLEFPALHKDLLKITASKASEADMKLYLAAPSSPPSQDFLDARNRIAHQCQRAIDSLQITAGFRWKWWLQCASIVLSAVLALVALENQHPAVAVSTVSVITSALLAGFLAPVAKDLLAVLSKARGQ